MAKKKVTKKVSQSPKVKAEIAKPNKITKSAPLGVKIISVLEYMGTALLFMRAMIIMPIFQNHSMVLPAVLEMAVGWEHNFEDVLGKPLRIEENTVVCIIEAMKVMNEVKAGVAGVVAEVLTDNAEPVEFGSKLFRIV